MSRRRRDRETVNLADPPRPATQAARRTKPTDAAERERRRMAAALQSGAADAMKKFKASKPEPLPAGEFADSVEMTGEAGGAADTGSMRRKRKKRR